MKYFREKRKKKDEKQNITQKDTNVFGFCLFITYIGKKLCKKATRRTRRRKCLME